MSHCQRRSYLAVRGWLVAALILACPLLSHADEPKRAGGVGSDPPGEQADPPQPGSPLAKEQRPNARYYKSLCKRPAGERDLDLCLQWRMAEAAKKQAKWAQRQFWATVAAIGALVLTVFFTGWAAIAAARAANAATKSVKAPKISLRRRSTASSSKR